MEWYIAIKLLIVDWGESHYVGTLRAESGIPAGAEKWITGFDHQPWREICKYFICAYKNRGRFPSIVASNVSESG